MSLGRARAMCMCGQRATFWSLFWSGSQEANRLSGLVTVLYLLSHSPGLSLKSSSHEHMSIVYNNGFIMTVSYIYNVFRSYYPLLPLVPFPPPPLTISLFLSHSPASLLLVSLLSFSPFPSLLSSFLLFFLSFLLLPRCWGTQ